MGAWSSPRRPSRAFRAGALGGLTNGIKNGIFYAMSETVTIDKAGRLIVPKKVRERLGLNGGDKLRMDVVGGKIEIERVEPESALIVAEDGLPMIQGAQKVDVVEVLRQQREERVDRIVDYRKR